MEKIKWTRESVLWLKDIYDYIAKDDAKIALKIIQGIYRQVDILNTFPLSGQRLFGFKEEARVLLYGHYRIAYLVKENNHIDILGVFHGSLDINRYLDNNLL
ncbi:MAG: type II toxin-antitoxin system RelE/ParE family toxin [Candidatus Margulisiibacteriota bacterium]